MDSATSLGDRSDDVAVHTLLCADRAERQLRMSSSSPPPPPPRAERTLLRADSGGRCWELRPAPSRALLLGSSLAAGVSGCRADADPATEGGGSGGSGGRERRLPPPPPPPWGVCGTSGRLRRWRWRWWCADGPPAEKGSAREKGRGGNTRHQCAARPAQAPREPPARTLWTPGPSPGGRAHGRCSPGSSPAARPRA